MKDAEIAFKGAKLRGWRCFCGEEVIPSREIIRYEILSGKRKSEIRTVTKSGGSLVVSIPKDYAVEFHLRRGSKVYYEKDKAGLRLVPLPS